MSKKSIVCLVLAIINLLCVGVICVWANPDLGPVDDPALTPTQTVNTQVTETVPTVPTSSIVNSSVSSTEGSSVPASSSSVTGTDISGSSSFVTDTSVPPINSSAPFVPDLTIPAGVQPEDKGEDNKANEFEEIDPNDFVEEAKKVELSIKDGGGDYDGFGFNKNTTSVTDEKNPFLFILSLVCWFFALGLATFAILFKPSKKATANKAFAEYDNDAKKGGKKKGGRYSKSGNNSPTMRISKKLEDDYGDGY